MNETIISNKIRCKNCGDIIESFSTYDHKMCKCGQCGVDGGKDYLQRLYFTENPEDSYEELSEVIEND